MKTLPYGMGLVLCLLTSCIENASYVQNQLNADPSLRMSRNEILSQYSKASCNPLDPDAPPTSDNFKSGLVGKLRYQSTTSQAIEGAWNHLDNFKSNNSTVSASSMYLSQLATPTRAFDQGFPLMDGSALKDHEGSVLVEQFALDLRTQLLLSTNEEEGDYELALLADDGARLSLGYDDNSAVYLDSPHLHSTQMICSTQTVHLSRSKAQPIRVQYFQGPRYHIALMAIWRKAGSTRDPLCGSAGNELFFDSRGVPTSSALALESRGWKIIPADVYRLPSSEVLNPCTSENVYEVLKDGVN